MPNRKHLHLARRQLDDTLAGFDPILEMAPPAKGWIRAIRNAIGMSGRQLAERLGLSKQSVARMEKDEMAGSLSIKTLRRVAEGLDCVLVYGLVPRTSLEKMVHDQARAIATERLDRVHQTMRLENQELNPNENQEILLGLIENLVDDIPAHFWDVK